MTGLTGGAGKWRVWLLLALALLPHAAARAQGLRVAEIEIRGNQRINRESILTVVSTRVGDEVSPERLERDRRAIEGLGWFRLVNPPIVQTVGGGARVVFTVVEWPYLEQLQITGSSIFTDQQLRAAIKTKANQVFNVVDWQADLTAIDKLYRDKGYVARVVANTDQPDFLERGILRAQIQELKVGSVKLKWPTKEIKDRQGTVVRTEEQHKTRNYVVLRELSQKPGALYNTEQLSKDYRALQARDYFETINPVVDVQEDQTVAITWELTEKRTGQVSVGAGYSPREQLVGRVELADQNFRGKGQAISVSGEIGTFGGDGAPSFEVQFHEPWLTSTRTSMTVNAYDKLVYRFSRELTDRGRRDDDDRYFERRRGGQLSFGRPFQWPVTIGMRFDDVRTGDLPRRRNGEELDFPRQDGRIIAGNLSRVWNTRDYVNNPTSGSFVRLSSEAGHAAMDQDRNNTTNFDSGFFSKFIVDTRKYIPLKRIKAVKEPEREQEAQKTPVLALRFLAGTTLGDVPFFEQFFMGGAETLRGYLEDRFWGNHMYLASVEYRRPLMNRILGVVFVDVGDAFGSQSAFRFNRRRLRTEFEQHGGFRPFAAIGIGLRIATPIGPIRLDVGYGEEGARTHFSIGHAF